MSIIDEALEKASDTKALKIGVGAMAFVPEMFCRLFPGRKAVVVADTNTWKVAAEAVQTYLQEASVATEKPFIFDDPDLYAEWGFLTQLENYMKPLDAIAIAVGSGVINDLTKLSSHHLGRRYMTVGTAASMDGYTAYGASVSLDGNKQTFSCPAPLGIILDPVISAQAPKELAASGYADLIAKIPAAADWILSDALGSEALDPFAFDLVQKPLRDALSSPDAIFQGDVPATEKLAEGLIMSGFAMQAMHSSRPASGTEHQFSHYWDMENLSMNGKHVSHGFKVGIGTLVSTACLEFLLEKDLQSLDIEKCVAKWPTWEEQEKQILRIFEGKPGHIARATAESKDKYVTKQQLGEQLSTLVKKWPVLKELIASQIMSYDEVYDALRRVHAPYEPEHIGISREKLRSTFRGIPYMRSRFTGMDVLLRCDLMDEVDSRLFGKGGHWEIHRKPLKP